MIAPLAPARRLVAAGLVLAAATTSACTIRPEQADLDGQDVRVVFLHTSDIHSRLLPYQMDVGKTDEDLGLLPTKGPYGGIARLSAVVRQERQNNPRLAYIETGDVFQGAPIFNSFLGEIEFKAMSQLGVDAFAIGNHEFDNGAVALTGKAIQFANFPMLGANYYLGDWQRAGIVPTGQIAAPYHIINVRGIRVGVIGLTAMGGSHGGAAKGVLPLRTVEVVQQYVDFLRPQVDLVAVASHVGYHEDIEMIPRTEGLDVVFGGHLHIALNPPNVVQDCDVTRLKREIDRYRADTPEKQRLRERNCRDREGCLFKKPGAEQDACNAACVTTATDEGKREAEVGRYAEKRAELQKDIAMLEKRGCHPRDVLLVHSGAFLKYVGKLEVTLRQCMDLQDKKVCAERDATGKCVKEVARRCVGDQSLRNDWEVIDHRYELVPMDSTLPDDPQMLQLLEPYILTLSREQLLSETLAYSPERIRRFTVGTGDSQLGNVVTDAMLERSQVWADFAVTNSLGIRSDLVAGPLDAEQMNNVFPFENSITVMYLSGFEVQEMMDFIAQRSASRGCQPQAQVSGVTAKLICKGCSGKNNNGFFSGNPCARRDYAGEACAQRVTVGGSGRACATDRDCERYNGKVTGEICTSQALPADHPERKTGKTKRCGLPLACTRSYRLATNDYVAHGGSGFEVLSRNRTQKNLYIPLRDAATDYLASMPACGRIQPTWSERLAGKAGELVVSQEDRSRLTGWLEKIERSTGDDKKSAQKDAESAYQTFLTALTARASTATGNEKTALARYRSCLTEKPDSDGRCVGVTCVEVQRCTQFAVADKDACQTAGRLRAALRCVTVPCVAAREDGRLSRDVSRAPDPDDTTYPE